MERIEAVTAEDVLKVARRVFTPHWLNLALIGPQADEAALQARLRLA